MNHVRDQVWHSPDLVEQIFSWLPPRSTLQFRRLAKRFNQYLTSPYFTRLNLSRCIERRFESFHPSTDNILFWPEEAKYSSNSGARLTHMAITNPKSHTQPAQFDAFGPKFIGFDG
ncbi:hypothetical protein BJ741DRAFT_644484 [Chytriomyces cf. hyalinus JEL632]|nr:hypothetical protein BJ741DRAFT_644484 [Chytriomyces cf. hyalinus JEL632]